jgi:hypothetical protein
MCLVLFYAVMCLVLFYAVLCLVLFYAACGPFMRRDAVTYIDIHTLVLLDVAPTAAPTLGVFCYHSAMSLR